MQPAPPLSPWDRGQLALQLCALEPKLGGIWLRARSGPVRGRFLTSLPCPTRKIHPTIGDDQLFGGVDLASTLAIGTLQRARGILDTAGWLQLTMAERCEAGLAARLAQTLDNDQRHVLLAIDEGADLEEIAPASLRDRLAFHLDLDGLSLSDLVPAADHFPARQSPRVGPRHLTQIAQTAHAFGLADIRPLQLTALCAATHARLIGRDTIDAEDLLRAVELVLAPRVTQLPSEEETDSPPPPPPEQPESEPNSAENDENQPFELPQDLLVEAVKAALPPDLLARLASEKAARGTGGTGGTGSKKKGNRHGRPLPSRAGRFDGQSRIDLVATLRTAAPWQAIRRKLSPRGQALHIRPSDIHVKRFEEKSDRLLIFAVDASGSAALARLAEAKGAIELLLAEAYARRDHVALIAFRDRAADLLLPPTRSLVQTKRRLAALPGGGGTPLASGLKLAAELGLTARARGLTPTVAILTDGRANIALDGNADRTAAARDATAMAKHLRSLRLEALVIDVSKRPERTLKALADIMAAPYIPLPRANAKRLSQTISASLGA